MVAPVRKFPIEQSSSTAQSSKMASGYDDGLDDLSQLLDSATLEPRPEHGEATRSEGVDGRSGVTGTSRNGQNSHGMMPAMESSGSNPGKSQDPSRRASVKTKSPGGKCKSDRTAAVLLSCRGRTIFGSQLENCFSKLDSEH